MWLKKCFVFLIKPMKFLDKTDNTSSFLDILDHNRLADNYHHIRQWLQPIDTYSIQVTFVPVICRWISTLYTSQTSGDKCGLFFFPKRFQSVMVWNREGFYHLSCLVCVSFISLINLTNHVRDAMLVTFPWWTFGYADDVILLCHQIFY